VGVDGFGVVVGQAAEVKLVPHSSGADEGDAVLLHNVLLE
jgi:hypothetical protein